MIKNSKQQPLNKLFSVSLALLLCGQLSLCEDKLGFVFQQVRHGARSPLQAYKPYDFSVPTGYLTPSGMRQRFLLGDFNRKRYLDQYQLLDQEFNPNQIYAQSTDV